MTDSRLSSTDLIPRLRNAKLAEKLELYNTENWDIDFAISTINDTDIINNLTKPQLLQFISDMKNIDLLPNVDIWDDTLPAAIERAEPVGLMSQSVDNIWFGSFEGIAISEGNPCIGEFWFYVNGIYKTSLTNYNVAAKSVLGCIEHDRIQVCQVKDGVCGWWAEINCT